MLYKLPAYPDLLHGSFKLQLVLLWGTACLSPLWQASQPRTSLGLHSQYQGRTKVETNETSVYSKSWVFSEPNMLQHAQRIREMR